MSLDEQGLVDLTRLKARDYSSILLRSNPFPSTAVPTETPLTTADRKPVLRRFTDVLTTLYSDDSSSVTVILGDYGTGKSHLLKLFKVSVNNKLLPGDKPILAIYAKSPGRNVRDLLLYLIDDIGREVLTKLASNLIFSIVSRDPKKFGIYGRQFELKDSMQIPEYLAQTRIFDLINEVQLSLVDVRSRDLVRAFLILPHPEFGSIAWRWFIGSSLSREERKLLGLKSIIDDSRVAEHILDALFKLVRSVGINGIVLLVDELEAITLIPGISRGLYQDAIRHLIDSNPLGLVLIFAITPTEWNKLMQTPSALERRLSGSIIDLPPFTKKDVQELIEKYLSIARTREFKDSGRSKIFPFTSESIETIFTTTKGIPYKVVTLCRLCIDNSAVGEESITREFVEEVIQKEGFR